MKSLGAGFVALDAVIIYCLDILPKSAILHGPADFFGGALPQGVHQMFHFLQTLWVPKSKKHGQLISPAQQIRQIAFASAGKFSCCSSKVSVNVMSW